MKKRATEKRIQPVPDEKYKSHMPVDLLKEADAKRNDLIGEYIQLAYPDKQPLILKRWRDDHYRVWYQMICRYEECGREFEATRKDTRFCTAKERNCRYKRHRDKQALKDILDQNWYWVYHQCEVLEELKPRMVAVFLSTRQSI